MSKIDLKNIIQKEDKYYVTLNLNTAMSSFGNTKKEALKSLEEVLVLYFENIPTTKIKCHSLFSIIRNKTFIN